MGLKDTMIFMIISIFAWITIAITGWISLGVPNLKFEYFSDDYDIKSKKIWVFWNYYIISTNKALSTLYAYYEPLFIHFVLFYMIGILALVLLTLAFFVLCNSFFLKKDINVISGMLGNLTKFHFVPLLSVSALFIIGECYDKDDDDNGRAGGFEEEHFLCGIIFGIIALVSLIFIHFKTDIKSPSSAVWIIKHGVYGCLIALLTHHVGYAFTFYRFLKLDNNDDIKDWIKSCYIAFSIIIGLANIGVSLVLKELIIPFINLLIYIGMTVQFFKLDKDARKEIYSETPGVINIIMMILSLLMTGFLGMKMRASSSIFC